MTLVNSQNYLIGLILLHVTEKTCALNIIMDNKSSIEDNIVLKDWLSTTDSDLNKQNS